MTNKEIAKAFQLLGSIMELHGENPFKIRSYKSAYRTLRALDQPLAEMNAAEISGIKGVGKAISGKINELLETGEMQTLERYKKQTPEGIQEMLNIKGFGPKKIMAVWNGLGVESVGELLYAVNENRLVELKGFGKKTQEELKGKLEYYQKSKDKYHYARLAKHTDGLLEAIRQAMPNAAVSLCGAIRRKANILDAIEILIGTDEPVDGLFDSGLLQMEQQQDGFYKARTQNEQAIWIYTCTRQEFGSRLFDLTGAEAFLEAFDARYERATLSGIADEKSLFDKIGLDYLPPELREQEWGLQLAVDKAVPKLIEPEEVKGILHLHTTYSDGAHSLKDMAEHVKSMGYEYLGLTDHSKSAFYANGLSPERVLEQFAELDALNERMAPFKIFKGIESDILNDGSLDYEEELLARFDFIIASVHSNLRMDEQKATARLIKAIEHPATRILGHPTGRLLLSRKGYPVDHQKIIDACAANGVAIELNANPYRLDIDWSWIPYALEKEVWIAVNPDAHSKEGVEDVYYGICSARKGGLTAAHCLNAKPLPDFEAWLLRK
jgi:DNA polymerase (family 10)